MSPESPSGTAGRQRADPRLPVRAGNVLRKPAIWVAPLILASVVVAGMTGLYISSVADPLGHLRGLPVAVVNQDRGATIGTAHLNVGQQIQAGLRSNAFVSEKLHLAVSTLSGAERKMDRGGLYATLVVPPDFTANLLTVAGVGATRSSAPTAPQIHIFTNQRAGTVGASLASGILQPALAAASRQVGRQLSAVVPHRSQTAATEVFLSNPIGVVTTDYRPVGAHTALGLSDFYVALLILMCGFLGATIVNSAVDAALGYATNEIGPRWRQRQPLPINRWQTLLIKWAIVVPLTAGLTGLMLVIATGLLGMAAPYPALLWLYSWLCAASVGAGTIVLFAIAGTIGQLIGLLLFVYAGLASAGGTVPTQALPSFLRALSHIEPLRQVLAGTRSIMYFGARGDAGLTRGTLAASLGLVFWLALGTIMVRWYDRKNFYRLSPDLLAHVSSSVQAYKAAQSSSVAGSTEVGASPAGETGSTDPHAPGQDRRSAPT